MFLSQRATLFLSCMMVYPTPGTAFSSMPQFSRRRVSKPILAANVGTSASARSEGLALALDDGTRKSHSMAENTAFVAGFFRGMSSKNSFAKLTASLYFIYEAMEAAFEDKESYKAVKQMDFASLRRKEALEADLEYYYGSSWRSTLRPSPATERYVDRINELRDSGSYLLVAHQYTRYLGDLFGGQMMAGMATRSLGLEEGKGISFYDFPDIKDTKEFIETWYTEANQLDFSDQERAALVDEANRVFSLNIGVFDELEGSAAGAVWKFTMAAFMERLMEANPVLRAALKRQAIIGVSH